MVLLGGSAIGSTACFIHRLYVMSEAPTLYRLQDDGLESASIAAIDDSASHLNCITCNNPNGWDISLLVSGTALLHCTESYSLVGFLSRCKMYLVFWTGCWASWN